MFRFFSKSSNDEIAAEQFQQRRERGEHVLLLELLSPRNTGKRIIDEQLAPFRATMTEIAGHTATQLHRMGLPLREVRTCGRRDQQPTGVTLRRTILHRPNSRIASLSPSEQQSDWAEDIYGITPTRCTMMLSGRASSLWGSTSAGIVTGACRSVESLALRPTHWARRSGMCASLARSPA